MTKYLTIFMALLISVFCYAQEIPRNGKIPFSKNNISVEIGGNTFIYSSINYERILLQANFFYLSGRIGTGVGIGWWEFDFGDEGVGVTFPLSVNGIFQLSNKFALELGTGTTFFNYGGDFSTVMNGFGGIRVQTSGGFQFRAGFVPLILLNNKEHLYDEVFMPWAGISFGYGFGKKMK
jgi:hypothetical protein